MTCACFSWESFALGAMALGAVLIVPFALLWTYMLDLDERDSKRKAPASSGAGKDGTL